MKKLFYILLGGTMLYSTNLKSQVVLYALEGEKEPTKSTYKIPDGVTLKSSEKFYASIFDENYLPYAKPTEEGKWDRPVDVNANKEKDILVNYQGIITTEGNEIKIPIELSSSSDITLPAFSQETQIDINKTEDNKGGTLILEWSEQKVNNNKKFIVAKIKAKAKNLSIKRLDINAGLGKDYRGVLLGEFTYPSQKNSSDLSKYELRVIPAIPDKKFGIKTSIEGKGEALRHQFLYIPVTGPDGEVWLNNNLGADYSNIENSNFNLVQQAKNRYDYHSFGSLFQWGREADGQEQPFWIRGDKGTWDNTVRWPGFEEEEGPNGGYHEFFENCPEGFHTPKITDYERIKKTLGNGIIADRSQFEKSENELKLPAPGYAHAESPTSPIEIFNRNYKMLYWTDEKNNDGLFQAYYLDSYKFIGHTLVRYGGSIRCVQD